jgi:hypothetical protein
MGKGTIKVAAGAGDKRGVYRLWSGGPACKTI